jgi:hypothetical protein
MFTRHPILTPATTALAISCPGGQRRRRTGARGSSDGGSIDRDARPNEAGELRPRNISCRAGHRLS